MSVKQTRQSHVLPMALIAIALLALLIGAMAVFNTSHASAHSSDPGYVRVVHAAPGAGSVDVFVGKTELLKSFAFGTVTDYVTLDPGSYRIRVSPAGKGIDNAVIDETVMIKSDVHYTAAALGTSSFSLKVFGDNNYAPSGKARVRVYHLSPNAGPVDVSVGGTKVISQQKYPHASGYLTVAPGSYTFKVTATNPGVTLDLPATLKAGYVYSVFAVGLYKGSPALQFVVAAYNTK